MSIFDCQDTGFMQRALSLAELGLNNTTPNPRVGCVLVKHKKIIGEGWTQPVGGQHAETQALADARQRHVNVQDATAYISLEPCNHFGRTPPCAQALIDAGIKRVVVAALDPNPLVAGQGIKLLQASGLKVETGLCQEKAIEINAGFFTRMLLQRPWIRLKMASSIDGKTALANGTSQWLTNQAARADGHHWRARACAVMTGIGTILSDDPKLNVRYVETKRQPLPIILDSRLQIPLTANILKGQPPLIFCAAETLLNNSKVKALCSMGIEVIALPVLPKNNVQPTYFKENNRSLVALKNKNSAAENKTLIKENEKGVLPSQTNPIHFSLGQQNKSNVTIDLKAVSLFLAERQINELHIEAGHTLQGAWIKTGLVDELLMYFAPNIIGNSGKGLFLLPEITALKQMHAFHFKSVEMIENNLRILLQSEKSLNYLRSKCSHI